MGTIPLAIVVVAGALILVNLVFFIWMMQTEKRFKRFFQGKKAGTIEDSLTTLIERVGAVETRLNEHKNTLGTHDARIKRAVTSVPVSRFNPFPDVGGNQSFAMCLLDEEGDGVVLSSLYARDRQSLFAKKVVKGKSEQELSDEEQAILSKRK